MDDGIKASLLYEWKTAKARLDFAITEAESQLVSVNKRLQELWQNLVIYTGMIVLPVVLWFFLWRIGIWLLRTNTFVASNTFVYVLLEGIRVLLMCVYVFTLPIWIFHLIKSIFLLVVNREDSEQAKSLLPPEKSKRYKEMEMEDTYRMEYQKLINVLSRYYLYRDNMNQIREKIEADSISLIDLKQELKQITYYETIHPANEFTSPMVRKAKKMARIILFGMIAVFVFCFYCRGRLSKIPGYEGGIEAEIKSGGNLE